MKSRISQIIHDESGTTLVEVLIAIVIMTILLVGGLQFVTVGREAVTVERYHRLALLIAESRLEDARQYAYSSLATSLAETNTPVTLGNIAGTRTTVVEHIDDDFDGTGGGDADGNTVDYKKITVTVNWASRHSVSLETYVSEHYYAVSP